MKTFEARYSGYCHAECGERIEQGDLVRYSDEGDLLHEDCIDRPTPIERPVTVCPSCWLIRPCDCEES